MELKRVNQIQVGDFIGLVARDADGECVADEKDFQPDTKVSIAYSGSHSPFKFVEVVSIVKCDRMSFDGSRVAGKQYEFSCSDGKTYSAGSGSAKYLVKGVK